MPSKTFTTNPGVERFETGGPNGLILVEAGKPFETDDPSVISILETAGAHALTSSNSASARADEKKQKGGEL